MNVSTHQPALQERFLLVLSFVRACRKWPPCRREGFWALTIPSLLTPSIFHSGICRRIRGKDTPVFLGFPGGSAGKESAYNARGLYSIPGLGRYPVEGIGYPLQYFVLENSMDCLVHRVIKSWTWLSDFYYYAKAINPAELKWFSNSKSYWQIYNMQQKAPVTKYKMKGKNE